MAKIAFVQDLWNELPGVMALSASLKRRGHETRVFIDGNGSVVDEVRRFAPGIVAFSCTTGAHRWAAATAAELKSAVPDCVIIAGGAHPTFYPEFIAAPAVVAICRGEGDDAICEFADAVDSGGDFSRIMNFDVKNSGGVISNERRLAVSDLDSLPLPDSAIYYEKYTFLRDNPGKMFLTGRGCPYSCSFCFNKAMRDLYSPADFPVRRLGAARAVEMIADVKMNYGLKFVRFDDDVFILDKKWLFGFLELYREIIGLPFSCLVRANLMTDEIAEALAGAGCAVAHFGIESGNEKIRNDILKKGVSREQIVATAAALRKRGIKIGTFNMLNLPGENMLNGWETVYINRHIRADYPWCSLVQPYPGTELECIARRRGLLSDKFTVDDIPTSYFRNSPIKNPDKELLENLHKFFYLAVKAPILWPLIRLLVKMPANAFFDFVFKVTYAIRYSKVYGTPLSRVLKIGRLNKRQY